MDGHVPSALVGREGALRVLREAVRGAAAGGFRFVAVAGEPGIGKTRLFGELAAIAGRHDLTPLAGRATEFEQPLPLAPLIDALDQHVDARAVRLAKAMPAADLRLLASALPALAARLDGTATTPEADLTGLARYRLYRAVRLLLEELARPAGLALLLDDLHWADVTSIELLDHLVRHPPTGRVLLAVAYRPAQACPRLAALAERAVRILVEPLTRAEADTLLGPAVSPPLRRKLYEASGGNPFYLEALARMGGEPAVDGPGTGELPPAVSAALQGELSGLSATALSAVRGAAVAGDEFEPGLAAVAAELPLPRVLAALNEAVARDLVRPATGGRFRFRHPLVRQVTYLSAAGGWRYGAHARLAAHLRDLGAPATARALHVERSGAFGDRAAAGTLIEAARAVAGRAPVTAAHWLSAALDLLPPTGEGPDRLELMLELARVQSVGGRLAEGRKTARELLRLLPADDHARRARAARLCALMERQLDRPFAARELLLDELAAMPDPQAPAAIPLRLRLVAESLMRMDVRAAQAVLDLMPETAEDWEPGVPTAVAALRAVPAYAAGRVGDALRHIQAAERLVAATPDEHLAEHLDAIAWLSWTQCSMGRYTQALRHFERAVSVARSTGQAYILTNLLAGQARTLTMLGRLPQALATAEESVEDARLLGSGQQLVFALTQRCLAASFAGDDEAALADGREATSGGLGAGEVWGAMARHALGVALVNAGHAEEGVEVLLLACDHFRKPRLDRGTLLSCCELLAQAQAALGRTDEALTWADHAAKLSWPGLPALEGPPLLARAHALHHSHPDAAAAHAVRAAGLLIGERAIDEGRALLVAGSALVAAGNQTAATERLRAAAKIFEGCGARGLHAHALKELRRLEARTKARTTLPYGLTRREMEVAELVAQGLTNQQVAEKLVLSVRTVETHLSRAFTKIGVTSRVNMVNALKDYLS